jgi:hypothetical protein
VNKAVPPDAAVPGSDACPGASCPSADAATDSVSTGDDGSTTPAQPTLCPRTGGTLSADPGPLPDNVQIVSGALPGGVFGMAADDSNVYWANQETIHRIALAGGADTTLFDQSSSVTGTLDGLALDGNWLFFADGGGGQYNVAKMPTDGSSPPMNLGGSDSIWDVGAGGGFVYYYDAREDGIVRVPESGGTPTVLIRGVDPVGMALGNGYVYFVHPHANATVYYVLRVPITAQAPAMDAGLTGDGGVPSGAEVVATTGPFGAPPVTDATNVYWGDMDKLMKAPLAGGTPTMLGLAQSGDQVNSVVASGGSVYWSDNPFQDCGDVIRTAADGSASTTIVHHAAAAFVGAVTTSYVYLLGGQVLRVPR